MLIELAYLSLIIALFLSVTHAMLPLLGLYYKSNSCYLPWLKWASLLVFYLISFSFFALIYAYINSDFSVLNVFENSNSFKPLLYKIGAVWSNHEGSSLLWCWLLSLFSYALAFKKANRSKKQQALSLMTQLWLLACFLFYLLYASNPLLRLEPVPIEGAGLNPLLQDPALLIHPPILYAGYVSVSIAFSFAISALLDKKITLEWLGDLRFWLLVSWLFLSAGIFIGSYWAYYELGWGGAWYFDPVENVSLLPWLSVTALLHTIMVTKNNGKLQLWSIFLSLISFALCLFGTFLVRSGLVVSIHSFALDKMRGIILLWILIAIIGVGFLIFLFRANSFFSAPIDRFISRQGAILVNNFLLLLAASIIFLGTLFPLLVSLQGQRAFVSFSFFVDLLFPILIGICCILPFIGQLQHKKNYTTLLIIHLSLLLVLSFCTFLVVSCYAKAINFRALITLVLLSWSILASLYTFFYSLLQSKCWLKINITKRYKILQSAGAAMAHIGFLLCLFGFVFSSSFKETINKDLNINDSISVYDKKIILKNIYLVVKSGEENLIALFYVVKDGKLLKQVEVEKKFFVQSKLMTVKTAQVTDGLSQFYFAPGINFTEKAISLQLIFEPLVLLIWLGSLIMVLGALLVLWLRKVGK